MQMVLSSIGRPCIPFSLFVQFLYSFYPFNKNNTKSLIYLKSLFFIQIYTTTSIVQQASRILVPSKTYLSVLHLLIRLSGWSTGLKRDRVNVLGADSGGWRELRRISLPVGVLLLLLALMALMGGISSREGVHPMRLVVLA